ncbi:tudor domain-containing protein 6-like [Seriola lalandi dorsalis]|uniref:tudor domain-containing protein 6-like n=1 Tax=Seriola lalandi dorsalis TaxID=1841481 RepID=UPI000C6FC9FE|nr:tudor domain-containing protein 6-like [Seriola lalandi dorsalis]
MCSIPGLPTPGSEVTVLITRVNLNPSCGLVELWVNVDDGRKHIYEQMREKIQIPERKFYGSEGKPGDLCLVYVSDTWHRARIVSIQSETYDVFLIDQGQPHVTTSETLAWAQSDSFLFPPEIESCILANVLSPENNVPEEATKFLKSLPGHKFKGLVQHVLMPDRTILLDIAFISKQMCKFGVAKKIPGDEFKCLVLKCLHLPKGEAPEAQEQNSNVSCQLEKHEQYFFPELLIDSFETVNVTEVTDPQNIFCKLHIFSKVLKILSEQIHQYYEEGSDFGEVQPQTCGDPCAAKGMSGRWHRSLLKQNITIDDGAVEVVHVDEGKTELVPVGDIRPLYGKFLRMPVVTYLCSLDGLQGKDTGWTMDQTDHLKSLLLNQTVVARFDHHNIQARQDVYDVTLYAANSACINYCFLEMAGLFPPSNTEDDSNVLKESIPSSFLSSLGDKQCMDLQNKVNVNVDDLQERSLPSTKNLEVNGSMDDGSTSGADAIHLKEPLEHPSTGFPSEVHHACDDDVFTVGSGINVKVSCIESLQKFWCQSTENGDSLSLLMQDLQNHYAAAHPQSLVESICVARNPDNNMWYRAKIIASHHSPVVDVRFIDYGQIRKVPLQEVRHIDPAFLRLNAQAFQCCLFNLKKSTYPTAVTSADAALAEFQKFVDSGATSGTGLKCVVKAITPDEEGLLLNMVDIETPSDSACKLLAQKCAQTEAHMQIPPQVPSDAYNYSSHNIEVGGKEKVWVTSSENVGHFYCQLDRNSHLFDKVIENVKQLIAQPQYPDHPLGLNSICFVRYTDNQWHRGQIVEMSPKLKVHFVDYGDTLVVNESDIRPFPTEGGLARSILVQAVPLGMSDVPGEVPQEVNQWFADKAIGHSFTISVVEKGAKGKLIVELFDGSLNVNVKIRERISKMVQQKVTTFIQQTDQQLSNSSEWAGVPNEDCLTQELLKISQSISNVSTPEIEHGKTLDEGRQPTLDVILEEKETVLAQTFIQGGHSDSQITQLSLPLCSEGNVNICMYKRPNISQDKTEEVYASCIVGPHYFWCQYNNTENLNMVSMLAQEAGQAQKNMMFTETLGPGSPCLALFSSDNRWYRSQAIKRTDDTLHVLFIDYGNEADVDINNVRELPQGLLDKAPQAFLCSLNGFDESKGTWDDQVYDDFYNLLVDKPLRVTVFDMEDHSEITVPQYAVQIECENILVNNAMQKYWKPVATAHVMTKSRQMENSLQGGQTEFNMTNINVSKGNTNTSLYKKPKISKNQTESVYASCIVEPSFFWCQYANTEDLSKLSMLAQEAGQAQKNMMFPETLGPGSPCLALFSSDNRWYRSQVIKRTDDTLHVLFIDYGNESDVDINNVRELPQGLLDNAPQAFLCSLNGFEESKGTWDDQVYDDFYNLLVDKPLRVTVFDMEDHSEIAIPQYAVQIECENVLVNKAMQKYWKPVATKHVMKESPQTENSLQGGQSASNKMHLNVSEGNANASVYKKPKISKSQTESVYASCIVGPGFFWCQYANTEDLSKLSMLAQEAGQAQKNMMFPETLGPGSPCLALFFSDNQWYRSQVIKRTDDTLQVLFIDYGNEADVDINNVRALPQGLLDKAPQAFLCSLNGFDELKGTWDDQVYDDFFNLLVNKPLRVTVFNIEDHSEFAVSQYAVEVECEGVVVNTLMEKYWKELDTDHAMAEMESVDQDETRTVDVRESVGV